MSRDRFTRASLREAQRVLDERPPLPPEEQAFNDRRRAELRAMVEVELARRGLKPCEP
jgi:hypothetical protein